MQLNRTRAPSADPSTRRSVDAAAEALPLEAPSHNDWRASALCAQTDPEAFFPDKGGSAKEALAVCRNCPVVAPCLAWALDHDVRYGVWGGQTENARRRMRISRRIAASGIPVTKGGEAA